MGSILLSLHTTHPSHIGTSKPLHSQQRKGADAPSCDDLINFSQNWVGFWRLLIDSCVCNFTFLRSFSFCWACVKTHVFHDLSCSPTFSLSSSTELTIVLKALINMTHFLKVFHNTCFNISKLKKNCILNTLFKVFLPNTSFKNETHVL